MSIDGVSRAVRSAVSVLVFGPLLLNAAWADAAKTGTRIKAQPAGVVSAQTGDAARPARVVETARPSGVTPEGAVGANAHRIKELNQLRGFKDLKDATHAAAHVPAHSGNLTDPAGVNLGKRDSGRFGNAASHAGAGSHDNSDFQNPLGRYAPALPNNRSKGSMLNLTPSANPADWMRGASGQDSGGRPRRIVGQTREGQSNTDGFSYSRTSTTLEDGQEMVTERRSPDGSSSYVRTTTDTPSGTYSHVVILKDERGNVHKEVQSGTTGAGAEDVPPDVGEDHGAAPGAGDGIARTIDPNADTGGDGSLCRRMPQACRGAPVKNPTHVNPGREPGGFAAPARQINPGDSIVINPSTENARYANDARRVDPNGVRRAVDSGTRVNPPGPSD